MIVYYHVFDLVRHLKQGILPRSLSRSLTRLESRLSVVYLIFSVQKGQKRDSIPRSALFEPL